MSSPTIDWAGTDDALDFAPGVYTFQPSLDFLDTLVAALNHRYNDLADVTVFLPNRRSCRLFQEKLLKNCREGALVLPKIYPLGEADEEMEALSFEGLAQLPPAIGPLRRHLLLTHLITRFIKATSDGRHLSAAAALHLSVELARLLDQLQVEGVSFEVLEALVIDNLAEHWQITTDFLHILSRQWPAIVTELGNIDPAEHRNRTLNAQADYLATVTAPVIVAGSTGSLPATAHLLKVIAGLPQGYVILPGVDMAMAEDVWASIEPHNPQYLLMKVLSYMGVGRAEVISVAPPAPAKRLELIRTAMLPATAAHTWGHLPDDFCDVESLEGFGKIECANLEAEAQTIAFILRDALEVPDKTAALVTAERGLARRVGAHLKRWGIQIDDSAGQPLCQTPAAAFFLSLGRLATEDFHPVTLLAVLKHPLCTLGLDRQQVLMAARFLDQHVLRGPRLKIAAVQKAAGADKNAHDVLAALLAALAPLSDLFRDKNVSLKQVVRAHIEALKVCAPTGPANEGDGLWGFLISLQAAAEKDLTLLAPDYPAFLEGLMQQVRVRPVFGQHPRLAILGLMEARLQRPDVLVLGGLNEGSWPPAPSVDPWLSRPMRAQAGLSSPDQRIGQTAHDFIQCAAAGEVYLTRAKIVDRQPQVPSRFLVRLDTLLKRFKLDQQFVANGARFSQWQIRHNVGGDPVPSLPPAPTPPVAARPTRYSVSRIEQLMADPYQVYAKDVLGLKPLQPFDALPDARDRGAVIHRVLEQFVRTYPTALPPDPAAALIRMADVLFQPYLDQSTTWMFWRTQFDTMARWFVAEEAARLPGRQKIHLEAWGEVEILPGIQLVAMADRIEVRRDGQVEISDYKTGKIPTAPDIKTGVKPQLPLEALLAVEGGFSCLQPPPEIGNIILNYWVLSGKYGENAVKVPEIDTKDVSRQAKEGVMALISHFMDENTPYYAYFDPLSVRKYSDYEHLERVGEWGLIDREAA